MNYPNAAEPTGVRRSRLLLSMIFLLAPGMVTGHQGATGVVKERMDMMAGIGEDMKGIKAMIQGERPFEAQVFTSHAESIRLAAPRIKNVFPLGSLEHPSEALPRIWEDWDRFTALVDQLTTESERLRDLAESQDRRVVVRQFARVGKTCRGCHTDFRKKQDRNK
jgi:cytochrome c556